MIQEKRYIFIFNEEGNIFFSDAPFYEAGSGSKIGNYLPMFEDLTEIKKMILQPIHPYEFQVLESKYFVDISLSSIQRNGENFFNLTLTDKTTHYQKFQIERSEKNKTKLENAEIKSVNNSLKKKIEDLENLLGSVINKEILVPVHNLKASMHIITSSKSNPEKIDKMLKVSSHELTRLEETLTGILEIHNLTKSHTFEQSYYCSLKEILDDAKDKIEIPNSFVLHSNIEDDMLYFVNKYHFAKIFQKLINFIVANSPVREAKIEIQAQVCQDNKSIEISILNYNDVTMADGQEQLEEFIEGFNIDSNFNQPGYLDMQVARKIIQMYNGELKLETNENKGGMVISLKFNNLPSKQKIG